MAIAHLGSCDNGADKIRQPTDSSLMIINGNPFSISGNPFRIIRKNRQCGTLVATGSARKFFAVRQIVSEEGTSMRRCVMDLGFFLTLAAALSGNFGIGPGFALAERCEPE
jgi:hypothetical protein